jgi:hypothetical protein
MLALPLGSCRSTSVDYRTDQLREMYPAGTTTRDDVQDRWNGMHPLLSVERPDEGWESCTQAVVARRAHEVSERTGQRVELVERYWGPDGWFGLCYCWYFYDAELHVVDVAWQYCSD